MNTMAFYKTITAVAVTLMMLTTAIIIFSDEAKADEEVEHDFVVDKLAYDVIPGTDEVKVYGTDEMNPTIPSSVTYSGKTYTVTSIGKEGFNELYGDQVNLTLPDTVRTLEERAFASCFFDKLDLNNVEKIGKMCFQNTSIEKMIIGKNVSSIYESAFVICNVGSMVVDDGNSRFLTDDDGILFSADGKYLYRAPRGLEVSNYKIPNGVEIVCAGAFYAGLYGEDVILKGTLTVPNTVREIQAHAFNLNNQLTGLVFEQNCRLKYIGCAAFSFTNLEGEFIAPDSLEAIGQTAFYGVSFTKIDTNNVRLIGQSAFASSTDGRPVELVFGDKLEYIEFSAFDLCGITNKQLVFPESVVYIGDKAFTHISGSSIQIVFKGDRPCLGFNCFSFMGEPTVEIVAEKGWATGNIFDGYVMGESKATFIDYSAETEPFSDSGFYFVGYSDGTATLVKDERLAEPVVNPVIPETVTHNGKTYVVTKIGDKAFSSGLARGTLTLPKTLVCIQSNAFEECELTGKLTIPSSMEYIGYTAFSTLCRFSEIDIQNDSEGNGLRFCDMGAFQYFSGDLTIPDSVVVLANSNFAGNSGEISDLRSVSLGNGLRYIGIGCFGFSSLKTVEFGSSLEIISDSAFDHTRIECDLEFPSTFFYAGYDAFAHGEGNMDGKSLIFHGDEPITAAGVFDFYNGKPITIDVYTNGWATEDVIAHLFGNMTVVNNHVVKPDEPVNEPNANVIWLLAALLVMAAIGLWSYRSRP